MCVRAATWQSAWAKKLSLALNRAQLRSLGRVLTCAIIGLQCVVDHFPTILLHCCQQRQTKTVSAGWPHHTWGYITWSVVVQHCTVYLLSVGGRQVQSQRSNFDVMMALPRAIGGCCTVRLRQDSIILHTPQNTTHDVIIKLCLYPTEHHEMNSVRLYMYAKSTQETWS